MRSANAVRFERRRWSYLKKMRSTFHKVILCGLAIVILSVVSAQAQKQVAPPPSDASLAELKKWLFNSLPKYASYKTRSGSLTLSDVTLEGCTLKFAETKKAGVMTTITEGAKQTVSTEKDNVAIDIRSLTADKISITDYMYEDLQLLEIKSSPDEPAVEMIVKRSAAQAIRSALAAAGHLCRP